MAAPLVPGLPFTSEITLNWRVLVFASAAALGVSILVGLMPAIRMSTGSAAAALNSASRGSSGSNDRARRAIVGAEMAVSVVLICGAALLFKSLAQMQQVDVGASIDRVITMAVDLPYARYRSGHQLSAFYPVLIERLRAVPGVTDASISGDVPLEGTGGENLLWPGRTDRMLVRFKRADAGYFSTMGIGVVAGRGFTDDDRIGAPYVTVVNEALASRLRDRFGVTDAVGQSVDLPALGFGRDRRATMTIVGVIRNERVQRDLRAPVDEIAYVPIAQAPRMQVKLSVHTAGDPAATLPAIREAVRQIDPSLALADIRTMEEIWERSLSGLTEPVWLIGVFARCRRPARGARALRRRRARRDAATARDRHPHGARRAIERRVVNGGAPRNGADWHRPWRRRRQRRRAHPRHQEPVVRSVRPRSRRIRDRRSLHDGDRSARGVDPGAPRHARRPDNRPSL